MADDRWMESPPEGVAGWRRVWEENLRYRVPESPSRFRRLIRGWLRRLVRSGAEEETERQRTFNLAALEMLDDLRRDLRSLHADLIATTRDLDSLSQDYQKKMPAAVQRGDALIAAVDQKVETVLARMRDITTRALTAAEMPPRFREDFLYRRLEDGLRGSPAEVRERLGPYLEYARGAEPVVDVGCGRGEFLQLCREAGLDARGFDGNERSVAELKDQGLPADLGLVPDCLEELGEGTVGSILATHVVEHLDASTLFEFFAAATRVLRPGGLLMIETPNAESLAVSASEFWRDPTHVAPRHAAALTLLGREFGYQVEELRAVHPFPEGQRLRDSPGADAPARQVVDQLNAVLFANQDLRLVLRKSG